MVDHDFSEAERLRAFVAVPEAAVTIWETLSSPAAARVRSPNKDNGTLQFKVATTYFLFMHSCFNAEYYDPRNGAGSDTQHPGESWKGVTFC